MLNNDPKIRQKIYIISIIVGALAIVFGGIPIDWADSIASGLERLAAYLVTIIGTMGATNLTSGGDVKLLESKTTKTD